MSDLNRHPYDDAEEFRERMKRMVQLNESSPSYDDAEEFRERMKRMVQLNESSPSYGRCDTPKSIVNPNNGTCAQIPSYLCGMTYQPPYVPPMKDKDIYYQSLGFENQKLREEKQHYVLQLQSLQHEVRVLREENFYFKQKVAKKKVLPDMIAATKTNINTIYQKIINWFNT